MVIRYHSEAEEELVAAIRFREKVRDGLGRRLPGSRYESDCCNRALLMPMIDSKRR